MAHTPDEKRFVHRTRDGQKIPLTEMSDSHLVNVIRCLELKARKGVVIRRGGGSTYEDFWYDEELLSYEEALELLHFSLYVAEAERRKLPIPPRSFVAQE